MDDDWRSDSDGKVALERSDFDKCVFQLADVQTGGVSADEYAEWITNVIERLRLLSSEKKRHECAEGVEEAAEGGRGEEEDARWWR